MIHRLNENNEYITVGSITVEKFEDKRLDLAKKILLWLCIIFLCSAGIYIYLNSTNNASKEVFDTIITIIPPIVTLIIGYYFSNNNQ